MNNDRYYEPDSEDDDYPDFFPERVAELMKTKYRLSKYSNFSEGICEAKEKDCEIISEMLDQSQIDFEALGRKLWSIAYEYMERYAEDEANEDYESGNRD